MTKRVYTFVDDDVYSELEKMAKNMLKIGEIELNNWNKNPVNVLLKKMIMEKVANNLVIKWKIHPDFLEN